MEEVDWGKMPSKDAKAAEMKISIIVVTYNSGHVIEKCLRSILECGIARHYDLETFVFDNCSSDGTREYLRANLSRYLGIGLEIFLLKKNFGMSRAVNMGLAMSSGDFILTLNPDVEVDASLTDLVDFAQLHPYTICAPTIDVVAQRIPNAVWIFLDQTLVGYFLRRLGLYSEYFGGYYVTNDRPRNPPSRVGMPGASALFFSRDTYRAMRRCGKFFDEQFPVFWNDVDMSLRAIEMKIYSWIVPSCRVKHESGGSSRKDNALHTALMYRGVRKLIAKWDISPKTLRFLIALDAILGFPIYVIVRGVTAATEISATRFRLML